MSLTQSVISRLKPEAKPYEIRDDKLKGFILRIQPSGHKSFIVEFGRGRRFTLGDASVLTVGQARTKALEILGQAARGEDPQRAKRRARAETLGLFLTHHYEPWAKVHHRSLDNVKRLRASFADLLNKQLSEITLPLLERTRQDRKAAGITDATLNREGGALKSALSRAVEWGLIDENPLKAAKSIKMDSNAIIRYLSTDEEARFIDALNRREQQIREARGRGNEWRRQRGRAELDDLGESYADHLLPMVLVSIHTGLRWGELIHLAWADVDMTARRLTVKGRTAKSKQTRHIPLNTVAHDALVRWQRTAKDRLVFPGRTGGAIDNVYKSFRAVLAEAGIVEFRWHDLRHHFSSRLVQAGVDLNTVRELLGHADIKMTLRYAHLAPEHKAAAVERIAAASNVVALRATPRRKSAATR